MNGSICNTQTNLSQIKISQFLPVGACHRGYWVPRGRPAGGAFPPEARRAARRPLGALRPPQAGSDYLAERRRSLVPRPGPPSEGRSWLPAPALPVKVAHGSPPWPSSWRSYRHSSALPLQRPSLPPPSLQGRRRAAIFTTAQRNPPRPVPPRRDHCRLFRLNILWGLPFPDSLFLFRSPPYQARTVLFAVLYLTGSTLNVSGILPGGFPVTSPSAPPSPSDPTRPPPQLERTPPPHLSRVVEWAPDIGRAPISALTGCLGHWRSRAGRNLKW